MWPPRLHRDLTALAESQDYRSLWALILTWCFPSREGFRLVVPSADNFDAHRGYSRTVMVLHRSSPNTLCAVTWSAPSKFNINNDPYSQAGRIGIFKGDRIVRLHTEGTHLSTYELSGGHKHYYARDRTTLKNSDSWAISENFDTDLLERQGLEVMISIVQKICLRIGVAWELRPKFLERYQGLQDRPTPPLPDRSLQRTDIPPLPKPSTTEDDTTLVVAPFARAFPRDVMIMILSCLEPSHLRTFALASTLSNSLAERLLWRTFHIRASESSERGSVSERFSALVKLPHRARYVRKLIVGPCDWVWDQNLLRLLELLWPAIPRLHILVLEMAIKGRHTPLRGNEFAPVIRSLVKHGTHLRLSIFKFEGWLRPGSDLYRFLLGQPCLRELIGVDMFSSRILPLGPDFLPSLQLLVCDEPTIARSLMPGRPLEVLQIRLCMTTTQLSSICAAVPRCSGSLSTVMLRVLAIPPSEGNVALALIAEHMTSVKRLVLRGVNATEEGSFPLCHLSRLESLECDFTWLRDNPPDSERISRWTNRLNSLNRVIVAPHCWKRDHRTAEWDRQAHATQTVRATWGNALSLSYRGEELNGNLLAVYSTRHSA